MNIHRRTSVLLAAVMVGEAGGFASIADAQTKATIPGKDKTAPVSQATKAEAPPPEAIIVTANKRSEALLKVPVPVTALSSADLSRQGATKLADYAADVPGLNLISYTPGQTTVVIRGITTGFGAATSSTTSTYIDDAPYGSVTGNALGSITTLDLDPGTLQRIEVLRGPQGTLYGASALGGLIKYVTTPPSLSRMRGRFELDGSAVDGGGVGYGVRAMLDTPLVQNRIGLTISGFDRLDPGYISDPFRNKRNVNRSKVYGGRAALLWRPSDRFSVELAAVLQDTKSFGQSVADLNADLTPIYGKYEQVRNGDELFKLNNQHYSLRASYDLDFATMTYITSYQTQNGLWTYDLTVKRGAALRAATGNPNLGVFEHVALNHKKTTQEIRLASPDGQRLEWLAGLFYTHEWGIKDENFQALDLRTHQIVSIGEDIFHDILNDKYTEYAGYADVTYHFTDKFKLLAGLRYTIDHEKSVTPFSGILFGTPIINVGRSSDKTLTYLVSPSYNFDRNNMLYARVATGFRPGGPTGVASSQLILGVPESYKADRLTNYEVGYKASYPNLRMTLDLSGFDIEWKDIQLLTVVSGFNVTGNGSKARSVGGEATWTWRPIAGLNISANGAYTHAYLTADSPAVGGKAGDELPEVPRFSGHVSADYDFPLGEGVTAFVGGSFEYQGSRKRSFVKAPPTFVRTVAPAYTTVDLRTGVDYGNLSFEAYIKNVGNSYGLNRIAGELSNGWAPPLSAAVIPPRTFGASITYKF